MTSSARTAVMRHVSGARRGYARALEGKILFIIRSGDRDLRIEPPNGSLDAQAVAVLHRHGKTYELEVRGAQEVWINGDRVKKNRVLASEDLLEIGHAGPVLRFRLYPAGQFPKKTLAEAFADSMDSARAQSSSGIGLTGRFLAGFVHDLATQTTVWFRIWIVVLLSLIVVVLVMLVLQNYVIKKQLLTESMRLDGIAARLEQAGDLYLTHADIQRMTAVMGGQLREAVKRVESLEARSDAAGKVIAAAFESVVYVQGRYGFTNPESGLPLRYMATPQGILFFIAEDGEEMGKEVVINFSGTAFVVSSQGVLLTNRHVAEPWTMGGDEELPLELDNLSPYVLELRTFVPGRPAPYDTRVVHTDSEADLAILEIDLIEEPQLPLQLVDRQLVIGEEVLVMGYPLGVNGMLVRAGPDFLQDVDDGEELEAWEVMDRLAAEGFVKPLTSRGIVSQLSGEYIVYDAETTIGGSGGPVFNLDGEVIGINTAIVREFGGSNLGIPAMRARRLLMEHEIR